MPEITKFTDIQSDTISKVEEAEEERAKKNRAASQIIKTKGRKKQTAFRIDEQTLAQFSVICTKRGMTLNSAVNMLISDFVKDNQDYLD